MIFEAACAMLTSVGTVRVLAVHCSTQLEMVYGTMIPGPDSRFTYVCLHLSQVSWSFSLAPIEVAGRRFETVFPG